MTFALQDKRYIIIFDGVCHFCNGAVNFIIKRDNAEIFAFTPMQSDTAKALMKKFQVDAIGMETFILIKDNQIFLRSDAALEISKHLSGYWPCLSKASILPSVVRDFFYTLFARNRYFLFGKSDRCVIPSDKLVSQNRSRFLE